MSLEQDLLVKPLTARVNVAAPQDLRAYEASGGYVGLRTAIKDLTPADLQSRVKDSNLRGRGGAGFPTGVKWGLVPMGPDAGAKYLVCSADEMEDRKSTRLNSSH